VAVDAVSGLLLCRAGPHRLAFLAGQVASVGGEGAAGFAPARLAYGLPQAPGKVLHGQDAAAVGVDSLEVNQEQWPLLPTPALISRHAGGSLVGFVATGDGLWPVLRLHEFWAFLEGARAHA